MAAGPVVLRTNVHCYKCADKIRAAIDNYLGVESVWASPERGLVVVHGTADAYALRRRIRHKMKRHVEIVSDGLEPYYGPSQPAYYAQPRAGYPYGGGGYGPSQPAHHYQPRAADPDRYSYAAAARTRRHKHNTAPTCACSIM